MSNNSHIFDAIGGFEAIIAAVDIFYDKVLADPLLADFFNKLDMEQQNKKMVSFMARAFGGPKEYQGKDLRQAHKKLVVEQGLSDVHFDAVAVHLQATLRQLEVADDLIQQVMDVVGSTRDEVLNR
ncbi:MAG: group 1 truncated hemoglobin [Pseudomonadales bacterium]|nr:group 1 truncated hemoglobin [Pseudomonadales bacterium]